MHAYNKQLRNTTLGEVNGLRPLMHFLREISKKNSRALEIPNDSHFI